MLDMFSMEIKPFYGLVVQFLNPGAVKRDFQKRHSKFFNDPKQNSRFRLVTQLSKFSWQKVTPN